MRRVKVVSRLTACLVGLAALPLSHLAASDNPAPGSPQPLGFQDAIGRRGGALVMSQRAEPKTLNPVTALDGSSREIIGLLHADLIHINRFTHNTEPELASSWSVSPNGRLYLLHLRRGLQFSDGQPFDADDVLFTFTVYLDERIHAPQRDLLIIADKPVRLTKLDRYTVQFELEQPYAAAERLFDGISILPRHLLKAAYEEGKLDQQWRLTTDPAKMAGLGPFQVKEYVPGQRITLVRNPRYWKTDSRGGRLPYLDQITSVFTGNADSEALRFEAGEIDVINRLSATSFSALKRHEQAGHFHLYDAGPSLEYGFLFFNQNDLHAGNASWMAREQTWFRQLAFRKAVSVAIDRQAIVRLVYRGRACPLSTSVTPGNKRWLNGSIPPQRRSVTQARQFLSEAGYSWTPDGHLRDKKGVPVVFSIVFNAGNPQHAQTATLIQADLEQTGMDVKLVPLDFHALLNRIFKSYDYDAALMALSSGDADPNSEMNVWTSKGSTHVWNLTPKGKQMPWETEIDHLMQEQMITLDYQRRKNMYDRVQELVSENLPLICLVSPDVLVGAANRVGNFRPANLSSYTIWNADQLFSHP